VKGNVRRTYYHGIGAEGRKPDTHLVASDARVHDLAQSLIVEAGVRQSRDSKVRRVQSGAPCPDPVFVATLPETSRVGGYGGTRQSTNRDSS